MGWESWERRGGEEGRGGEGRGRNRKGGEKPGLERTGGEEATRRGGPPGQAAASPALLRPDQVCLLQGYYCCSPLEQGGGCQ